MLKIMIKSEIFRIPTEAVFLKSSEFNGNDLIYSRIVNSLPETVVFIPETADSHIISITGIPIILFEYSVFYEKTTCYCNIPEIYVNIAFQ